jgi:RimJ/RimL family protein N-acetyltransferase
LGAPLSTVIRTERLDLIPMTAAFLRASIAGDLAAASTQLELSVPADWPDVRAVLELRLRQLDARPELEPWLLRAIKLRSIGRMIGHIGFHSAPGAAHLSEWCSYGAELGFTIFAQHRRKGYAREASTALMRWAQTLHGVTAFVVTIGPGNSPSLALAKSLGFARVGSHMDEVDGVEDIFLRSVPT